MPVVRFTHPSARPPPPSAPAPPLSCSLPPPLPLSLLFFIPVFSLSLRLCRITPPPAPRAPLLPPPDGTCKSHGRVVPLTAPRTLYFLARIPRGRKARLYFYVGFNRGFTRIFETISPLRGLCVSITSDRSRVEDRSHRSLHISCTLTH